MKTVAARVPARVHLAGNPSDGYGGAVLSTCVAGFAAEVTITPSSRTVVVADRGADTDGGRRLVDAALVALETRLPDESRRPGRFSWSTTIPRSVGLGGSSAIVIATMRAALAWWEVDDHLDDMALAHAALAAEVDVLGIAAGLADRAVQARGGTVLTDCRDQPSTASSVTVGRPVDATLVWNEAAAESSDGYHRALACRIRGGAAARDAMVSLADAAQRAAAALSSGDHAAFGDALDLSLVIRRSLGAVPEAAIAPVDDLRSRGAKVNFAGSGGALVVVGDAPLPPGWLSVPLTIA